MEEYESQVRSESRTFAAIVDLAKHKAKKPCRRSFSDVSSLKKQGSVEPLPAPVSNITVQGYELLKDAVTCGAFEAHPVAYTKYSKLRGSIVCIEGIISAGKTTLGKNIANYLNSIGIKAEFYQEFVEESLLHLFYSDPAKYAFAFQV